jgi:hypothetical protein
LLEEESLYESVYNAVRMDAQEAIGLFGFAVVCSALVYAVAVVFL